ncbi:hypothetical protein UlMin_045696 [Ulmus minor]
MGSCKVALELWRKKQTDVMRVLPRLGWWDYRALHSAEANSNQFGEILKLSSVPQSTVNTNNLTKVILGANENILLHRRQYMLSQLMQNYGANTLRPCFARSMSSHASKKQTRNETKKEISTVEDPFDAPTYNIPEKPVSFTEGASYTVIILVGLGIAAAAGYAVFKELIFEPKEYKIFNKALKRIQDDAQVRVRIGYPITGYGQESRNRAARQRIPNRTWTDEEGVEHVEVNFYVRGPNGAGKVFAEMYKDQSDRQWKFTYLIVEIKSPSPAQLILESYLPSYAPP